MKGVNQILNPHPLLDEQVIDKPMCVAELNVLCEFLLHAEYQQVKNASNYYFLLY